MRTRRGGFFSRIILLIAITTIFLPVLAGATATQEHPANVNRMKVSFSTIPLYFIENTGQLDSQVRFYEKSTGHSTFFTKEGVHLLLTTRDKNDTTTGTVVVMKPLNGNPDPAITAENLCEGKVNYFTGNDPSKWHVNIPTYGVVVYKELYPGIDLRCYGNNGTLEYDLVVKPGADLSQVRFAYEGIEGVEFTEDGDLNILLTAGSVIHRKPIVYQEIGGRRVPVQGYFEVYETPLQAGQKQFSYGFTVAHHDTSYTLVIDPVLVYSTYLGGSSGDFDYICGIAVDSAGNAYIAGYTSSSDFPTLNPYQGNQSVDDVFVTKLSADGSSLIYSTYLGGSSTDRGYGIAVDSAGNAYITGHTNSTNFPIQNAYQESNIGTDVFVAKLNASGSGLIYSTYLGGSGINEIGYGIAVDSAGNAYVTGFTDSTNFPTQNASQESNQGIYDAFVTKLSTDGSSLVYSTYLGGSNYDYGFGIAVDSAGNAYVTGYTESGNFPLQNAYQDGLLGYIDAFVTKLSFDGESLSLEYSTYLGGSSNDYGHDIAVDSAGNAHITGETSSADFPIQNAYQEYNFFDAFVAKLSADGSGLIYSTFLGGSGGDYGFGIAVDSAGNAYVTGYTDSADFPTQNAFQENQSGTDAFVTKLSTSGNSLVYSTYLGGNSGDYGYGIAVNSAGNAYVTGYTDSGNFPIQNAYQGNQSGTDVFITKFSIGEPPVADAGADQTVDEEVLVTLNGSNSYDPDSEELSSYQWAQTGGTAVELSDSIAVSPTFTAPAVDAAGDTLTFELTVEDNEGLQDTDTCVVNVSNVNILPMSGLFDSSGGESSISVSVGAGFAWTAVSNDEWITITSDSSGVGDGTVSYSVDATTSSSGRMGTLTIAGETFIVDQIGVNGASWSDNFNGGPQQSWIVVNTGTNSTATPTSNRYELHTEGSDYTKWIGAAANVSADDCTIQAKVQKILPGDCFHPTMSLRISRSALNFYTFGVVDNGPGLGITIGIRKRVGGVYTLLAAVPNISGLNMSSPFYMKFSALGNQLSGKVWNVGDPEPAEWMVEVEDNDIPSGGGGIGMAANYNCFVSQGAFDDVVFTAPNIPPVADAGPDQLVDEEVLVTLDGSGSTDSDGTIASYLWTKMAGPAVTLSDPTAMNPTFTSPSVGAGGASLTFQLTVTDNGELQNTDTCVVNVSKVNVPPVADAGPNQTVDEEVVVTLNGSGSTDPDGTIASWQWTQTGGPAVTLSDSSAMSPTFTSPTVGVEGEALTFELTVTDDGELQDTDTCIVNVSYVNLPPIANAGPDQTVDQEVEVTIDGSASHDDDGTIVSYHWEQTGGPSVFLSDPASVTPVFTTPLYEEGANILTFILTVTDDGGLLGEDTCTITVIHNNPPEPPLLTGPEDGAIFVIGDAITLTAGAYDDPEDDAHVESQWCIRRTDRPTYDYKFTSSTDLTQYSATGLLPGLQYAWKVGYKDAGSGLFTWSEEWTFSVGPPIVDTSVSVPTGFTFEDYRMVSFTVWPDDPAATSVFGITPDTTELRIAGYDPTLGTGGYREYGDEGLFINPGSSYWFLVRGGITPAVSGIAVSLDVDIDVPLLYNTSSSNGWNMIAPPNSADYKWEDIQVLEYDAGGTIIQGPIRIGDLSYENTMIDKRLWRWESGTYYSDTAELDKNAGYWLKARTSNVWLRFPADAHLASATITKVYVKRMMKEAAKLAKVWGLTPAYAIAEVSDTPPPPPGEFTGGGSHFSAKEGGGCFITTTERK